MYKKKEEVIMKFKEYDVVRAVKDIAEANVKKGDVGTVLLCYTYPNEAYEVEFSDETVGYKDTFAVLPEYIEKV